MVLYDLQELSAGRTDVAAADENSFSSLLICSDSTITCTWCH